MTETSEQTTFDVLFDGRLVAGQNATDVEQAFAKRFGDAAARSVFTGSSVKLKKALTRDKALNVQRKLEQLGMVVLLVPNTPPTSELALVAEPASASGTTPEPTAIPAPTPAKLGELPDRKSATPKRKSQTYSRKELDDAFKGEVVLPSASKNYMTRLVPVTLLMLLLPLIYIAITAFCAFSVFWMLTSGFSWWFSLTGSAYLPLFGFATSVLALGLLTLFLLRPLIASPPLDAQPVRLDPTREAGLYHLVDRITDEIGAPMPDEILVDTNVNASARLTKGAFSNELTLTIGLPLFYGLDVQTLTGILAHEFGHFTQTLGMRSFYLVHRINFWFYRQVHDRDSWDDIIDDWLERDFVVLNFAAMLAGIGSVVVSILLMALSSLASLFSHSLSRQMEFDADRYEIGLLGSEQYPRTAEALRLLMAGHHVAMQDLGIALDGDKLVDNLPKLAVMKSQRFSEMDKHKIMTGFDEINTSVFDTHPTDKERIRKAAEASLPAQFELEGPAENLLMEVERLAKLATLQWYRSVGVDAAPDDLTSLDDFDSETDHLEQAEKSSTKFFGSLERLPQFLPLLDQQALADASLEQLKKGLVGMNLKLHAGEHDWVQARQQLDLNLEYQFYYGQAIFWRRAGFDIDLNAYRLKLTTSDMGEIDRLLNGYREEEHKLRAELARCAELQGKRLSIAMEIAARADEALATEVAALRQAYTGVSNTMADDMELQKSCEQLDLLIQIVMQYPEKAHFERPLQTEVSRNEGIQGRIRKSLASVADPRNPSASLADALPDEFTGAGTRDPGTILADAARIGRQLGRAGYKLSGRMAEIALPVERDLPIH